MSETDQAKQPHDAAAGPDSGEAHSEPHLPPPSYVPISVALALAVLFVGFLGPIRDTVGPTMWVLGLLWLITSLAFWFRGARREFLELPEESHH